jgi:hypothetical protein
MAPNRFLVRAYGWPERRLLGVNAVIALFVIVSHGGALMIATSQNHPALSEIRRDATFSLPLATLLVVSSLVAALYPASRPVVLRAQTRL